MNDGDQKGGKLEKILANDLVSIIVPVFNAQKKIKRSLDSIVNQTYKEIEIIVIDDGSTDESLNICKEYELNDQRFHVYHIDNQGVSAARNYGVKMSSGKWIMFVDADDRLDNNSVEIVLKEIIIQEVDILCWNSYYETEDKLSQMKCIIPEDKVYEGDEIENLSYGLYCINRNEYYGEYFRAVWGKIFRTSLIKDNRIEFTSGIRIGEDALFMLDCLDCAQSVRIVNLFLYYYNCDECSVTRRYKKDFLKYQKQEYDALKNRLSTRKVDLQRIGKRFWRKAEKDYIDNELKSGDSMLKVAKRVRMWIVADNEIYHYLSVVDEGEGIKGKIRSSLISARLLWLVAIYDTRRMMKLANKFS